MEYLGHYDKGNNRKQLLKVHLENVANLAEKFAKSFDEGELAKFIGKYHDIGKYSKDFQNYIRSDKKMHVDHSTAGARLLIGYKHPLSTIIALCIAGHHGGIPDMGGKTDSSDDPTLFGRIKRNLPGYDAYQDEIGIPNLKISSNMLKKAKELNSIQFFFYIHMLYSCLVDADFLDTENFMSDGCIKRDKFTSVSSLHKKMMDFIEQKFSAPSNALNKKRCEILQQCIEYGQKNTKGLFSLTVPTGGGKTISSLAFALNHAVRNNMERIIYVIPYTSIIEQNAKVFADILGEENILEHHMNVDYNDENDCIDYKKKLATENWDAPIIVTTNVQFFESLFGNKPSKCRKLHNIANSVIIFDEAQMIPLEYLKVCTDGIKILVQNFNCTAVLCSATQPKLDELLNDTNSNNIKEIINNIEENYEFFKRNNICRIEEKISKADLSEKLAEHNQVLCIVNKKKTAQEVFSLLKNKISHDGIYHLSTNMYPIHRKHVLSEIKLHLKNNLPCIVVSTSLIEAGVDIDFPAVYRELIGLDSIVQSGGRCNREGKLPFTDSNVYVFELSDAGIASNDIGQRCACALNVMCKYNDLSSIEAIKAYFRELYNFDKNKLDKHNIEDKINEGSYKEIADKFKVIEDNTKPILIPVDDDAKLLAARLTDGECNRNLMRLVSQYSVNIYANTYNNLSSCGKLYITSSGIAILNDLSCYDDQKGLEANCEVGKAIFF